MKIGMMVTNDHLEIIGRVIFVDEDNSIAVVQEFMGNCHEVNPEDCKEVSKWVRLMMWMHIAKRLRRFFVPRIAK